MVRKKKSKKLNIPMCMALVLFSLTMLSVYLTSSLYAKYVTHSEHDEKAITIGFGQLTLTESGDFNDDGKLVVIPGWKMTKNAELTFSGSESATYVFAEVELKGNWSYDEAAKTFTVFIGTTPCMNWTVDPSWDYLSKFGNDSQPVRKYVFYQEVAPNTSFSDKIIDNDGQITIGEEITKDQIGSVNDISIKFRGIAVQSDGFASVGSAWDAVSIQNQ